VKIDRGVRRLVAMVLIAAVVSGCSAAVPSSAPSPPPAATLTPTPTPPSPPSPPSPTAIPTHVATPVPPTAPTEAVSPFDDSTVGCSIGAVQVAETNAAPLTALAACQDPVQFATHVRSGGLVTTDPCGQAVLDSRCGRIYVFQDSGLRFSHCDQQTAFSAAGCLTDGTIAWNNTCPAGVATIVSPNASIELHGTWVSATYLPDRQLTLFTVLEGQAVATPLDATGAPSGVAQDIPRNTFWFTAPLDPAGQPVTVGGVAAQAVRPIEEIEPVIGELQLESWMAAVKTRAGTDGVKSDLPAKPVVNVRGRGGPFDDKAIQEALLSSMDWQTAITNEFPGGESTVFGLIGDGAPSNLAFQPLDLEAARGLIERSGLVGTPVTVIVDDSEHAPSLAKNYTAALEDIYLRVEFVALPPEDGAKLYEERGSRGLPTIWLSSR
jgi:hypothetical protein